MKASSSISIKLFRTLQKGKALLGKEALDRIGGFVESQRTEGDAFVNKGGKADVYYTVFGWMLSYLLGIRLDAQKTPVYLATFDTDSLDLIHYAAYMRCRMIQQFMKRGKAGLLLRSLFPTEVKALADFKEVPHNDLYSPYTRFIWLSLLEDTGQRIPDKKGVMGSLGDYQLPEGGYRNIRDGLTATTNATAAALVVRGQLEGYQENKDVFYLRDRQDISGGFHATMASPIPDLLSTATALFVLSCYKVRPKYAARDFIEAHWLDSGGFSSTLLEDKSDVEYTFYGLLALGAIATNSFLPDLSYINNTPY